VRSELLVVLESKLPLDGPDGQHGHHVLKNVVEELKPADVFVFVVVLAVHLVLVTNIVLEDVAPQLFTPDGQDGLDSAAVQQDVEWEQKREADNVHPVTFVENLALLSGVRLFRLYLVANQLYLSTGRDGASGVHARERVE